MNITLDKQVVSRRCPECEAGFSVVRGSVFDDGRPFGLYLIALLGHSANGRLGHLAVALMQSTNGAPDPLAAAMDVAATTEQFGFTLVEWASSPWQRETYLGRMLAPAEIRASMLGPAFFHVAKHVVEDLSEVRDYFATEARQGGKDP